MITMQRVRDGGVSLRRQLQESWQRMTVCQRIDSVCSICQMVGTLLLLPALFALRLPGFVHVLLGIAGFAAMLKLVTRREELEEREWQTRPIVAIAGFLLIVLACLLSS